MFLQAAVGGVFLAAAIAKTSFRVSVAPFLTGLGIPSFVANPIAVIVPAIEAAVGALLVTGVAGLVVACAAALLSTAFAAVQVYAYGRKPDVGCNCFGLLDAAAGSPVIAVARALMLASLAVSLSLIYIMSGAFSVTPSPAEVISITIPALCSGLAAVVGVALLQQSVAFERERPRIRPISALELTETEGRV